MLFFLSTLGIETTLVLAVLLRPNLYNLLKINFLFQNVFMFLLQRENRKPIISLTQSSLLMVWYQYLKPKSDMRWSKSIWSNMINLLLPMLNPTHCQLFFIMSTNFLKQKKLPLKAGVKKTKKKLA